MNTPVSFELAKLLKEKEFDNESAYYYTKNGEARYDSEFPSLQGTKYFEYYDMPTIAEVVMWLYEKHGLWTNVVYMGFELKYSWSVDIITTSGSHWDSYGEEGDICYNSPTEAYEAAIEYTLTKLI